MLLNNSTKQDLNFHVFYFNLSFELFKKKKKNTICAPTWLLRYFSNELEAATP